MRAARGLLDRDGYARLTMEAVASEAGVGKATLYRRWPNRAVLAMEAFLVSADDQSPYPDTGSAREDLRVHLRSLVSLVTTTSFGRVLAALVAETHYDPALATAFLERYITVRRQSAALVISRGIERGELRPGVDADVAVDTLYGALYYRLLISHAPLDATFTDALVEQVLGGLACDA